MPDVTTSNWFPVVTLVFGFGMSSLSEWLQHRRTTAREREAREAVRREQFVERRINFQRQPLLDLQEAVAQLARATGAMHHQDKTAYRATGEWHKNLLPPDLDEGYRLAQVRTSMLAVRVRDDSARQLVAKLRDQSDQLAKSATAKDSDGLMMSVADVNDELNQRIGELLRKLDDAAE